MSQNDDPKSDADEAHETEPDEAHEPNPTTGTRAKAGAPPPSAAESNKTLLGMPAPGFDPSSLVGAKATSAKAGASTPKPVGVPKLSPRAAPKPAAKSKLAARGGGPRAGKAPGPGGKPLRKRQATLLGVMAPGAPKGAPITGAAAAPITAPGASPAPRTGPGPSADLDDPHDRPTPIMESPHERPTPSAGTLREEAPNEGESTQEIEVEDMLAAEAPPPPPPAAAPPPPAPAAVARASAPGPMPQSAGTTSDWQPSPEPLPASDEVLEEPVHEPVAEPMEHVAGPTLEDTLATHPKKSRRLLLGTATLALVAAVGLAVYAAAGRSGPAQPGKVTAAAAPPAGTAAAPPQHAGSEATATKPAEAKPAEAKPAEAKPAEAKPAEAKPAEAKPAEAKPAQVADEQGSDEAQAEAEPQKKPADKEPDAHATAARRTKAKSGRIDVPDVPKAVARLPARARNKRAARMLSAAHRMFRYKKYDKAEELYRRAWQYSPNRADIADGIALTLQRKGDHTKAIAWERKAIRLDPHRGGHYFLLGTMLEDEGHVAGARRAYRKASALSPRDKRPRYRLKKLDAKH